MTVKMMKYVKFFIISVPLAIALYGIALFIQLFKEYGKRDKGVRE